MCHACPKMQLYMHYRSIGYFYHLSQCQYHTQGQGSFIHLFRHLLRSSFVPVYTTPEDTEMAIIDCPQETWKFNRLDDKKNENNLSMKCFTECGIYKVPLDLKEDQGNLRVKESIQLIKKQFFQLCIIKLHTVKLTKLLLLYGTI